MDNDGTAAPALETDLPVSEPQATPLSGKPRELHPSEPRRGNKPLPTNRIAFAKQLDLLRAFAASGGIERKAVVLSTAAKMVGMTPATASLANGFFVDAGLLIKVEGAQPQFQPSVEVAEFAQAHAWAPDIAGEKLAPALQKTWAWKALEPALKYSATVSEVDAVRHLAEACGASPDYRPQLIIVLQYMETAGLLSRDGQVVRRIEGRAASSNVAIAPEGSTDAAPAERPMGKSGGGSTNGGGKAEGQIRFAVSMNFDVTELRGWSPERIARLFEGISKVIAARGGEQAEGEPGDE